MVLAGVSGIGSHHHDALLGGMITSQGFEATTGSLVQELVARKGKSGLERSPGRGNLPARGLPRGIRHSKIKHMVFLIVWE